ncbi:MAG: Putative ATP:guanido phosphotransferase YacI [Clostridiales bacterium 38_11]|nr:MAG: Putative ATP:guanido phosphotransferase YacI [Clostridiales bacterium 38_11]HBH13060.1 protein arginine kinase [Clostridiales bacterium]
MIFWLQDRGEYRDVVVSSRIRLARNLDNYRFPIRIGADEAMHVYDDVTKILDENRYLNFKIKDIPIIERNMLVEKHIISPALLHTPNISGFSMSELEDETIMINEEDHIRIQVLDSGLSLKMAWAKADKLDNQLEKSLSYAYDEKIGYLTSCPTNLGTGLRASVMLHLPAMEMTKEINKLLTTITQFGLAVRGVYGEGTKALGSLYQISNQYTLGDSEETIIKKIDYMARQIAEKERITRDSIFEKSAISFEDKIFRAYGILKNTRIISADEAVRLISFLKLGITSGLIQDNNINDMDKLFIEIQPASIQYVSRKEMNDMERDIKRAEIIRNKIN